MRAAVPQGEDAPEGQLRPFKLRSATGCKLGSFPPVFWKSSHFVEEKVCLAYGLGLSFAQRFDPPIPLSGCFDGSRSQPRDLCCWNERKP